MRRFSLGTDPVCDFLVSTIMLTNTNIGEIPNIESICRKKVHLQHLAIGRQLSIPMMAELWTPSPRLRSRNASDPAAREHQALGTRTERAVGGEGRFGQCAAIVGRESCRLMCVLSGWGQVGPTPPILMLLGCGLFRQLPRRRDRTVSQFEER